MGNWHASGDSRDEYERDQLADEQADYAQEAKGKWSICPECEASFKVAPGKPLPPHRAFRGAGQCPGAGSLAGK